MSHSELPELRALLTALTGFSARAGHDMAGPLNQASSLLALFMKRYKNQIDEDADQLLDYVQNASQRMEEVANGVRKFMELAAKPTGRDSVDLNESLASALERLQPEIARSGANVIAARLPVVTGDAAQLTLLFEHLVGNSIKFRDTEVSPRVYISVSPEENMQAIAIRDEGFGVDPEDYDSLFVPFKRLNGCEFPGPGLGLAMARLIVERHGGRISMVPVAQGPGTCVRFTVRPL
ncbi:MAG: ATP-binding protein [Acidobacteriota bacterium]|nr:ATP-binding protein [Acidobacteriota bacterium]